ncbi:hypothetical protein E2C01_017390 [Portunus trituberculatus]|uniref:Uncharacterized protein n=1 Tax=Portunus trituberculatus TaxID=210409 RepID=A0A5B7DTC1_PORTR|nr:hypothetical protein [Portunus trituberculatus]
MTDGDLGEARQVVILQHTSFSKLAVFLMKRERLHEAENEFELLLHQHSGWLRLMPGNVRTGQGSFKPKGK